MVRREKAGQKAARQARKVEKVEYQVEGEDIVLLSGPFAGQYVSQLFFEGAEQRDFVVKHLWLSHDEKVMEIIRRFLCR